ncbi:hypothetical protein GCM10023324_17260 [Streptomyces youssoufiensis]
MVVATVYGVAQLLVLSTPTRSLRVTTVLLAIAVGVYGCGAATALLEYAYTRTVAEQPDGRALRDAVERASYTVDPVLEEMVKVAPLLLVAGSRKLRRQWGLTDYTVAGGALGAGFGLLEAVSRYGLDADRATGHSAGGWLIPTSLTPPYIPGPDQVFSAWFPAPFGTLDLGATHPAAETSQHLVLTALCGLGVGILVRGRRWLRLAGLLPIGAACAQHILVNYSAAHRSDRDIQAWVADTDAVLWVVPLLCLAIAIGVDLSQLRRAKRALPGVLIDSERAGHVGLEALGGYGLWRLPWSMLIALRFARMRRALLYGVDRGPYPGAKTLHRTVAWSARQIDASDHLHAWRGIGVRSTWRAARAMRDGRRVWFIAVSLVLMAPAALFLLVGSFPATARLQNRFETGNGPAVLMGFGIAAFVWIAWQLIDLLRTWRVTGMLALAEAHAVVRFRLCAGLGALAAGGVLLGRMSQEGLSLTTRSSAMSTCWTRWTTSSPTSASPCSCSPSSRSSRPAAALFSPAPAPCAPSPSKPRPTPRRSACWVWSSCRRAPVAAARPAKPGMPGLAKSGKERRNRSTGPTSRATREGMDLTPSNVTWRNRHGTCERD